MLFWRANRYRTEVGIRRQRYRLLYASTAAVLGAAIVITAALAFLLYFPLWRVREVRIQGLSYMSPGAVEDALRARVPQGSWLKHLLGMHNLLVWPDSFSAEDLKFLWSASAVTISKDYLRGVVTVQVAERPHLGIWCFERTEPPQCFWFDGNGLITRTLGTEGNLLLVVNDYARDGIRFQEPLVPAEFLPNLFSIFDALRSMDITRKEIRLNDLGLEEIQVPTFDGPDLLFSLRFPAVNAPAGLKALQEKTALSKLEYVDFRVENRVYYK